MRPTARMNLDRARVVTARELSRDTASVIDSVVQSGEPAVVTKHGRLTAVLVSLANVSEASLLSTEAAQPFVDTLGTHDTEGVAQGLTARDALEQLNSRAAPQSGGQGTLPLGHVSTVRRLNQNTSVVLNEVRDSGRPAFITRYGRLLVALLPVPAAAESELLGSVAAKSFAETLGTGLHDGAARGLTVDQARAHALLDGRKD